MNNKIKEKFERLPFRKIYIGCFITNLILIFISLISCKFLLPPLIPLFYGLPQGDMQITNSYYILIPALLGIFITSLNAFVSIFIDNQYLKKVLAFSTLIISILAFIAILKIIILVGNI